MGSSKNQKRSRVRRNVALLYCQPQPVWYVHLGYLSWLWLMESLSKLAVKERRSTAPPSSSSPISSGYMSILFSTSSVCPYKKNLFRKAIPCKLLFTHYVFRTIKTCMSNPSNMTFIFGARSGPGFPETGLRIVNETNLAPCPAITITNDSLSAEIL